MSSGRAVNDIQFVVRPRDVRGVREAVPVIDRELLTDLIDQFELSAGMQPAGNAYGGLVPAFSRFGPLDEHFRGRSARAMGPKTPLLGCECGEWGCWPLMAQITVTDDDVVWDSFEQPYRRSRDYSRFGPFCFERRQYEAALQALSVEFAAGEE